MRYLAKKNFLVATDKEGKKKSMVKKGTFIDSEKQKFNADELLEKGMIVHEDDISFEELEDLEKKIQTAKQELASLEAELAEKKKDLPVVPSGSEPGSPGAFGEAKTNDADDLSDIDFSEEGDLSDVDLSDGGHEEVEIPGDTPEAPMKKVKVKKKKNRG